MTQDNMLLDDINERELEIVGLLAEGLTNREIADRLFLAVSTVKWYITQINSKLGTANRKEIIERADELDLLNTVNDTQDVFAPPKQNLPRQTTLFVGRDSELDELHTLLERPDIRLLTILAPGGMGKTRIALEAAEQQLNNFRDGVYFVPLQPINAPDQIVPTIAASVFFAIQEGEESAKDQLLNYLGNKELLLVIDNWEHVLDGAPLANEILKAAPNVKILATSREKLNLLGEASYTLQGMRFPDFETPEDALRYDAVQLLVQTAKRVQPDWKITDENLDYVARVCRLTQGMPLGILLAITWLDVYSLERICDEIQKSVDILETDIRDVPERQRSIRAVFDYSWERLKPNEQAVFAKMSVFRGGCTPAAAEAITGANPRILQGLVNKALLSKTQEGRYAIHELLRQYADDYLLKMGEKDNVLKAHFDYYSQLLINSRDDLISEREVETVDMLEADDDNLMAAWDYAIEQRDTASIAKMIRSHNLMLDSRWRADWIDLYIKTRDELGESYHEHPDLIDLTLAIGQKLTPDPYEALPQVQRMLDISREHNRRFEEAQTLRTMGLILAFLKRFDEAEQALLDARTIFHTLGNTVYEAWTYLDFFDVRSWQNNYVDALQIIQKGYDLFQQLGYQQGMATALKEMGKVSLETGNVEHFLVLINQSRAMTNRNKHPANYANRTFNLIHGYIALGQIDEAYHHILEVIDIYQELNNRRRLVIVLRHASIVKWLNGEQVVARELIDKAMTYGQYMPKQEYARQQYVLGYLKHYYRGNYVDAKNTYIKDLNIDNFLINLISYKYLRIFAVTLAHTGDTTLSITLMGAMFAKSWFIPPQFTKLDDYKNWLTKVKADITQEEFDAAWARGGAMDIHDVEQFLEENFGEDVD